jgi:predicted CXXCH cytochrome family protein
MARLGWLAGGALTVIALVYLFARVPAKRAGDPPAPPKPKPNYVEARLCAGCHEKIWETYRRTGMGRSFSRPQPQNTIEDYTGKNTFFHKASGSYFAMIQRDGKYYQRRHQIGFDGKETNVLEKEIHFIMGSGAHVRTYLHRTRRNTLVQLPLAWYAENGGYWAMNPGYDRPDHQGFRRKVTYDCMFCHNGYPEAAPVSGERGAEPVFAGRLPEGVDCQRCHGPGGTHVQAAQVPGAKAQDIRNAIVNPARLDADRQMEVCMQCHLETTSFRLPNAIQRFERGPFSYTPGEPLGEFALFFDEAPGKGRDDKFEIVNSAYRLRRSACFQRSEGRLRCTTCHNPHNIPRGEAAAAHYNGVCRQCHAASFDKLVESGKHPGSAGCTGCHMPARRTDDVVHAVMTDHYIQRRKPARDLLAKIAERPETEATAYHGEVVLYYPPKAPHAQDELYLGIAQVSQKSNLDQGITQLAAAIEKYRPEPAEYYFELADAWRKTGQWAKALPLYEEAVRRRPNFVEALRRLALGMRASGQPAQSAEILKRALQAAPDNADLWHELGLVSLEQGQRPDAVAALSKAVDFDPDLPETHNSLGQALLESGDKVRAESEYREAIRIQPDYPEAHSNLANLLSSAGDLAQARYHFETALRFRPDTAGVRYNYGVALARARQFDEAQRQIEAALRADPRLAEAHEMVGNLLARKGQAQGALKHYREALRIRPDYGRAHLNLGAALAALGDVAGAAPHLRKAAESTEPAVRDDALQLLQQLPAAR